MSDLKTPHHVTRQPMSLNSMDPYSDYSPVEKPHSSPYCTTQECECSQSNTISHGACHKTRLRRLLIPAVLSIATVATIFFICCLRNLDTLGIFALDGGVLELGKHALGARDTTSGSSSGSSSFMNNKLYIIVIIVGLFLVLVMGIMLSAWCCRESFENPCCCPCYLCACCGGLACLDCIACGLCAEGYQAV